MALRELSYPTLGYAGRLGNQLWQIASTVGLAREHRMRPWFPAEWAYRPYFQCPDTWFGTPAPKMAQPMTYARHLHPSARSYLQDLALWRGHEEEILRSFQPTALAEAIIDEEWDLLAADLPRPVCAVHIRRGDYATNPLGTVTSLPLSYYQSALDHVNPGSVIVFSDDIEWCRAAFPGMDRYYEGVARPKEQDPDFKTAPVLDWIDLFLQARCTQHVISNSTYSWWGAWLSRDPQPRYPSRWYGDELSSTIDFRLMIPSGWTEIEVDDS